MSFPAGGGWLADRWLEAELWCEDKSPWPRLPLLAYLAYAGVRHLWTATYQSWFSGITLAFHEMGHIVFSGLGNTMMILGGSILQVLVPLVAALYLWLRQGDFFGLAVGGSWLAFSLAELSLYVYDAPREELPLVGFGDDPQHDWGTLLTRWHVLNHSDTFAFGIRVVAFVIGLSSLALGAALCWQMWKNRAAAARA
jgi:hypothetical protein